MIETKFSFAQLRRHTEYIRAETTATLRKNSSFIQEAFDTFDAYIKELEGQPATLERNVKLMLACKLLNHVYSALILTECGLIVDAILCGRNALEVVACHWLVCLDPDALTKYANNNIARPVEVRRRLEKLGADISQIRDIYSGDSKVAHVGRTSERFHSEWESQSEGVLRFGGALNPEDQNHMFGYLPALLHLFLKPIMV